MRDGVGKIVLRQAIADIVPEWVLARPKQGFGAPMNRWLASHLGDVLERMLSGPAAARYLNRDVLERRLRILRSSSKAPAFPLWPVLNFLLWHRLWIEGESLEPVLGPPLEALSS
jgi:asparagine synthase (glutamine-hydrolysing)